MITTRRLGAVLASTLLLGLLSVTPVLAQATDRPAGGVGSTTAPSNSEGTPSGGSGNVGNTRVGPATTARQAPRRARRPVRRPVRNPAPVSAPADAPAAIR